MKIIIYILITLPIIVSNLIACDDGYTELSGECYYTADLDALVAFSEHAEASLQMEYADVLNFCGAFSLHWNSEDRLTFIQCTSSLPVGFSIPPEIGNLTQLTSLWLFNQDNLVGSIPPEIGNLTQLEQLYIKGKLTGSIPSELGDLDNLQTLDLRDNNLTNLVPNSFCKLSNITLKLDGNNLCEPYPTECDIADEIGTQQDVGCPCDHLSTNQFPVVDSLCYSGLDLDVLKIFATTSNLSTEYVDIINMGEQSWNGSNKLTNWICTNCSLTGDIPSEIDNLTNLTSLNLSINTLSGSIPNINNLTNLTSLNLASNNLSGAISNINNLTTLTSLNLSSNTLSGSISDITNLTNLTSLNLSSNNLSGSIPAEIGSYDLLSLDLSNNELIGIVPEDICTYYGATSYYNFDSNILCPPYPQCSSTSSDEQLSQIQSSLFTYVPDENNDGDGNIDPLTWCEEKFCVDPQPPEGHDCYGFIIDTDPTDAADACDPGEERDACGVCGTTTTLNSTTNCCATNNMGFPNGTSPIGNEPDQCGICGGLNTDCSSGQSATCPDADEYCGSCFGHNECIPQLVFTEPDIENSSIIDINTRTIRFHFSVPVNYLSEGISKGIDIDSDQTQDLLYTVETNPDSIIELTLTDPLISFDDLTITINPCKIENIRSNNNLDTTYCLDTNTGINDDIIPELNEDPIQYTTSVSLLGDYDLDEDVDDDDLSTLLSVWKTEDFSYELGPWSGEAPNLQPNNIGYDADYDLHDLMGFVQMWNWYNINFGRVKETQSTPTINYVPEYNFENNQMTLNIENFPGDVKMLSLQLNVSASDIEIINSVNSSQFDINLNGSHIEHGIYDWVMGSFSPLEQKNIDLFTIVPSTTIKDVNLQLAYEIIGFDQEISSGEINIYYNPVPEKITITPPYPNPFNPTTMINYGIPEKSDVLIEIYNLQGRLIDKTVRLDMETGYYTFTWDGSNQSSGIYLIRMKISDTVNNYRTLLIK